MFLFNHLRFLLISCTFISTQAMDKVEIPDFVIINKYDKIIHLKIEFEGLDDSGLSGESDLIIFNLGEQKPINLRRMLINNCETHAPIDPAHLNLKHIIVSAWVPGSELNNLPKNVRSLPPKKLDNDEMPPKASWNPLSFGWNKLSGAWNTFMKQADETDSLLEFKQEEIIEETQSYKQLEGCAAIIQLNSVNLIQIVIDPIRELPMISGEWTN